MVNADIRRRAEFGILVLIIGIFHFLVGIYYATSATSQTMRPALTTTGEEYLHSFAGWDTDSEQDTAGFNRTALSILQRGLPFSRTGTLVLRTAVYSYFVAACYAIGGVRLLPIAIAQGVLSGLTGAILVAAASRLFAQRTAARLVVGVLYLLNLRFAMYVGYVVPLILTLFFVSIALWGVAQSAKGSSSPWIALSLILGIYTSSTFFIVALAGALWLLIRHRAFLKAASIVLFVALKFFITWSDVAGGATEANRAADRGGIFWLSNNPFYDRMRPWSLWEWRGSNLWSTWTGTDGERERYKMYLARSGQNELRATLLWIRENPCQYLQVCLARLRTEFGPYTGQMSPRNRLISTIIWLSIFPAGFYGLWQSRRDPSAQFVALIIIAVFAFATLVTEEPFLRYRMPVDILLTVFAGVVYAECFSHFRRASNSSNTAAIRSP